MGRVDADKVCHWIAVVDATGSSAWPRRAGNDGSAILDALDGVLALAGEVCWAMGIAGATSVLLPALPAARGQDVNLRLLGPRRALYISVMTCRNLDPHKRLRFYVLLLLCRRVVRRGRDG